MGYREQLKLWIREALGALGGEASIVDTAKHIWANHENDLKQSGDGFYLWQYDMRWAADQLRRKGMIGLRAEGGKSVWTLKN